MSERTFTSPDTGIVYDVTVKEEHTDRCWLCNGTGIEAFETEADEVANEKAWDEWEPEDGDYLYNEECPKDIKTGRRTCERCNGTGKVSPEVGGVRITLSTHFDLISNPKP